MFNMKNLFLRALLALSIAIGAPAALAGPLYRVSIDTSSLAGTGYLDLGFNGLGDGSRTALATIGNFSGDFLGDTQLFGDVSGGIGGGVLLGNATGFNFFDQAVRFGGLFSFDVSFDLGSSGPGTLFSVALMDDTLTQYLGGAFNLLTIDLVPGDTPFVVVDEPGLAAIGEVAAVPEPGEWLLLATGLMLICLTRRMQQRG